MWLSQGIEWQTGRCPGYVGTGGGLVYYMAVTQSGLK